MILLSATLAGHTTGESGPDQAPLVAWTHQNPGDGTSPRGAVAVDGHPTPAIAVAFHDRVDLMDEHGEPIWSAIDLPTSGLTIAASDLNGNGIDDVLIATFSFDENAMLTALDGATGQPLWTQETTGLQVNQITTWSDPLGNPLVLTATLVSLDSGNIEAFDASDGTPVWSQPTQGVPTSIASIETPLPGDGVIVTGTTQGSLHYHDGLTGHEIARQQTGTGTIRDLVQVEDQVIGNILVAVGQEGITGLAGASVPLPLPLATLWSYTDGNARFWSAAATSETLGLGLGLLGGTVYVNGYNGPHVHAIDATTGQGLWKSAAAGVRTSFPFTSPQSILVVPGDDPLVLAAGAGNRLIAYHSDDGATAWTTPTPGPTDSLVRLTDQRTAYAHNYWLVSAVDDDGSVAWHHDYSAFQTGTTLDFNGDGTMDAVVASAGYAYVISGADGQVLFEAAMWPHLGNAVTTNIQATDLTGNGAPDVLATARTGTMQGVVIAFDGQTGDVLWTAEADWITGGLQGSLILHDLTGDGIDDVIIGSNRGHPSHVIALNGQDGSELWRYHVQDDVRDLQLIPTDDGPRVLVLRDHTSCGCFTLPGLVALDAKTGEEQWTRTIANHAAQKIETAIHQGRELIVVIDSDDEEDDGGGGGPLHPAQGTGPRFLLLDPLDNTEHRNITIEHPEGTDIGPFFMAADLTGDGNDEIVYSIREPGERGRGAQSMINVLSGTQDTVLWQTPMREGLANILHATPTPGEDRHDVTAAWGDQIVLLQGDTGTIQWTHPINQEPVWFLTSGTTNQGDRFIIAPQGTLLQGLVDP